MRWWWQIRASDADLERELRSDLELEEEEQRELGLSEEEARFAARRAVGNVTLIREQTRDTWGWGPFERLGQDVRYALRNFRKKPWFAVACMTTLALGIGATTTISSITDALLLRPLPYPNAPRVVQVWNTFAPRAMMEIPASEPEFLEYRLGPSFAHFAAFSTGAVTLTGTGDPLRVAASWTSSDFFEVLGVTTWLGRSFTTDEYDKYQLGRSQVAILSYGIWQSRFASSPDIVGKSIFLNGQITTVVGVMPRNFGFPSTDVDVWEPLRIPAASTNVGNHYLSLIAELKPQVPLQQGTTEMATILARIERKYPEYYSGATGLGVSLIPLRRQMVGNLRPTVLVLMAGVGFILLIACTNVAGLLLARGEDRQPEMAARVALGASRARILSQVLIENLLIFFGGGALGLGLAFACLRVVTAGDYLNVIRMGGVDLDYRVLAVTAVTCLVTGLFFGSIPALKACSSNVSDALKAAGRDAMGTRRRTHGRGVLVVTEIAVSLLLLTGAGLMIGSLAQLLNVRLGFNPDNVVTMRLSLPQVRYSLSQTYAFFRDLQDRLRALPAVQGVAIVNQLPMSDVTANASFEVEGVRTNTDVNVADTRIISPDYFHVMGISILQGRFFAEGDGSVPPSSVIVNHTLALKLWPGTNPIGKRIRLRSDAPWLSVIGVAADIKNHGPNALTKPEMYFLDTDQPSGLWADFRSMNLVIKVAGGPEQIISPIRGVLKQMDPALPVYKVSTLEQVVASSVATTRFPTVVLSLFGSIALLLSAVGVYGILGYTVAQSKHEIGVRIALGAPKTQVLRFFVGRAARWAATGSSIGIIGALILVRFMRSMLFQMSPYDPRIFVTVPLLLSIVVLLASLLPALRATRVDPLATLKSE
jgi:putative ABC transport system permease protein